MPSVPIAIGPGDRRDVASIELLPSGVVFQMVFVDLLDARTLLSGSTAIPAAYKSMVAKPDDAPVGSIFVRVFE